MCSKELYAVDMAARDIAAVAACSPGRQRLVRKPTPQVFDDARPLIVSGEGDKGLEPDPDEPAGDDLEFPVPDADKPSRHEQSSRPSLSTSTIGVNPLVSTVSGHPQFLALWTFVVSTYVDTPEFFTSRNESTEVS